VASFNEFQEKIQQLLESCRYFYENILKHATVKDYSRYLITKFKTKYNIGTTSIRFAWSDMIPKKAEMAQYGLSIGNIENCIFPGKYISFQHNYSLWRLSVYRMRLFTQ
jgi:hypothetical protein